MADDGNTTPKPVDVGQIIDMASRRPVDQTGWSGRIQRNGQGWPWPTVSNAMVILANDPAIAGMLGFDSFTSQFLLMKPPPPADLGAVDLPGPYPRVWGAEDVAQILAYVQRVHTPKFARAAVEDAMLAAAHLNRFHPVTNWLDSIVWDGTARLDKWLCNAFDCSNTRYHRAVGSKFLVAAVRRVKVPGCKFDHMLVLEGPQGIGKSRACQSLFGDQWFSDAIPPDLTNKDAAMALLGIWCLEFAEIEHLIRHEVETIKAFLSRSVDRYRPPYGKAYVERPRQGVLIGTTNADDYLRDVTGNRRIWPVRCKSADPAWIEINREQLWAEAAVRERRGETIWLDDEDVHAAAGKVQDERMDEDVWRASIAEWLLGRAEIRIGDILSFALNMPKDRQAKKDQMRVGLVLRTLGWKRKLARQGGPPGRLWLAPGGEEPPEAETDDEGQSEIRW